MVLNPGYLLESFLLYLLWTFDVLCEVNLHLSLFRVSISNFNVICNFFFIGKTKVNQLYLWGGAVRTVLCRTRACDELKVRSEIIHDKYLFDYLRLSWIWIVWRRLLDCCKCCNWSRFVSIIWNRERYLKSGEHIAVYLITGIPGFPQFRFPRFLIYRGL